jgi:hypothetical protein
MSSPTARLLISTADRSWSPRIRYAFGAYAALYGLRVVEGGSADITVGYGHTDEPVDVRIAARRRATDEGQRSIASPGTSRAGSPDDHASADLAVPLTRQDQPARSGSRFSAAGFPCHRVRAGTSWPFIRKESASSTACSWMVTP